MHPYRPLFLVNESRESPSSELRGLAVLPVVLGILRVVPAVMHPEPAGSEIALATDVRDPGRGARECPWP